MNSDLVARVREFIEMEGRSCSMDRALILLNMFTVCGAAR